MTADPRVEAVAEALRRRYREPFTPAALAPIAVAALDAHDEAAGRVHEDAVYEGEDYWRPIIEADLRERMRERIAHEIEAMACPKCIKAGRGLRGRIHEPCGSWLAAARIARGQR